METADIVARIQASIAVKESIVGNQILLDSIHKAASMMIETYRSGGKVLFCGNGGSAADAQHLYHAVGGWIGKPYSHSYGRVSQA